MERARRHQRLLAGLAFGVLAVAAELVGAGLTHRIDLGRHVRSPSYSHTVYYPALLAAVKVGIALLAARLVWRVVRARATERDAHRVIGVAAAEMPRPRVAVSPRLWLAFFAVTATAYLVHADLSGLASERWAYFFPWVHSSALPVFAVLSVLMALAWNAVQRWLADYEEYVEHIAERARRLVDAHPGLTSFPRLSPAVPPRRRFGLVLDSRPPPFGA
jgi:hypothetical protein